MREKIKQGAAVGHNEFESRSFGKCVILKQTKDNRYSLIYCMKAEEFVVVTSLNKKNGDWLQGSYFDKNITEAVKFFNSRNKLVEKSMER